MANTRWINQTQPQTLVVATIIFYINTVFGLIFGEYSLISYLGLVVVLGPIPAGLGIANEKKWGYWLGVAVSILTVVFWLATFHRLGSGIINIVFSIALVALVLHPMSREYYKTWFR